MSMSTQSFLGLIKYKNTLGLATLGFGTVQGGAVITIRTIANMSLLAQLVSEFDQEMKKRLNLKNAAGSVVSSECRLLYRILEG